MNEFKRFAGIVFGAATFLFCIKHFVQSTIVWEEIVFGCGTTLALIVFVSSVLGDVKHG